VLIVIVCIVFGIPPAYEAGRLAGFAAAIAVLGAAGTFATAGATPARSLPVAFRHPCFLPGPIWIERSLPPGDHRVDNT
jgi:hypothetical protein